MTINFKDKKVLSKHVKSILDFYAPNVRDTKNGGYHQNFYDDGTLFSPGFKHLVSSTRIIFNYCKAYQHYNDDQYLELANYGLDYLLEHHWDEQRQAYIWLLDDNIPVDKTNHAYGLAFVILSLSICLKTGVTRAREPLYQAWKILNQRFWQTNVQCYADEATENWETLSSYRGQNANMHCCEALLMAFDATGDSDFLDRAYTLATTFVIEKTKETDGLIWEHYNEALEIDWEYNKSDPKNLYRPWGFQPGHQTEWTKLLLILHRHKPESWMVERAEHLFTQAVTRCWDNNHGGFFYGHAPDGTICDSDKYFWVQAETLAAAALLAKETQNDEYWQWYQTIWEYCWSHMIDHQHGAWYRVLTSDNCAYSNEKSAAGAKCDYHTQGAIWEIVEHAL